MEALLYLIPGAPLAGASLIGLAAAISPQRGPLPRSVVHAVACIGPGIAMIVSGFVFAALYRMPADAIITQRLFDWIVTGSCTVGASLAADRLTAIMLLFVTLISFLIHIYSIGYMAGDTGFTRYFSLLNLFLAAMLILVLGSNLVVMFLGWEGVGLCSYLLIGFWFEDPEKARAGKKAFIANRIGDCGFMLGICLLYAALSQSGATGLEFTDLQKHTDLLAPVATAAALLLFIGACGKSAQIPLYVWLPDAMAGPTPVSALIHAATMVTAGVYMVARMHFLYSMAPAAQYTVAAVGILTALFAASIGIAQNDIKKILAYSTISQLGYMFLGVGTGAYAAGIFHVVTHAFFKACLFLCAGSIIHALGGVQDIRQMGGLFRRMPVTSWTLIAATAAICGFPPFSGFFSKDEILLHAFVTWGIAGKALWTAGVLGACLTSFYMARLMFLALAGPCRTPSDAAVHIHESPLSMTGPLVILAGGAAAAGFIGVPHVLGGENRFFTFLEPVFAAAPATAATSGLEMNLMAVSLVSAGAGFYLAFMRYYKKLILPTGEEKGLYGLVAQKYYIDELYAAVILRPIHWTAQHILYGIADVRIIDGFCNSLGRLVRLSGQAAACLQNGSVRTYLYYILAGFGLLIAYML